MSFLARVACLFLPGLGLVLLPVPLAARESNGTAAAKVFFGQGDAVAKAGKPAEAAAAFRKAIEADPDFVDAHQRFIESTQRAEMPGTRAPTLPRLEALYARWATEHPKVAAYQWGLGFLSSDTSRADAFFRAALKIDPAFARAHFLLARNADLRGDWVAQREHLKAAVESNPDEPRYLLRYAQAHKRSDPPRFRELASSVVQRFPDIRPPRKRSITSPWNRLVQNGGRTSSGCARTIRLPGSATDPWPWTTSTTSSPHRPRRCRSRRTW